MVVAVGGTALWVQHCNQTDHHSEGPPCEIAYVYPGIPVIAGGAMLGAFIGGRRPGDPGVPRSVYLVHGDPPAQEALAPKVAALGLPAVIPAWHQTVSLD